MISIANYLFEQDNVPVPQTVLDARANSLAAMRARLKASGQGSLEAKPVSGFGANVATRANETQPTGGAGMQLAKMAAPQAVEAPHAVDAGTWGNIAGKLAKKTVQSVTN